MALSDQELETLSSISQQLRDEGGERALIDLAPSLTKGQYRNADESYLGAMQLMAGAYAELMMDSPTRPKCCILHEMSFVQDMLQGVALHYSRVHAERMDKEAGPNETS